MMDLITVEKVRTLVQPRPRDAHKGMCGRVAIAAGSFGMAGAAVLSCEAALRSGAGLVRALVPERIISILQTAVPQATCMPLYEEGSFDDISVNDAVAAGPGLGTGDMQTDMIEKILDAYDGPLVIDADGINNLCARPDRLRSLAERDIPAVLTPHPGEADRLLKALDTGCMREHGRKKTAEIISMETGSVVLLKGADTLVVYGHDRISVNTTGNPGMATGGSGDVLTGVIAALLAGDLAPFEAAEAGAFIHGMAGDITAGRLGEYGMTSLDIVKDLPEAFKVTVGI